VPASWDPTDPTNICGFQPLAAKEGPLVDGLELGDDFFVYATDAIYRMTYLPENLQQPMMFESFTDGYGALATGCVVEWDGQHVVLGQNDIYMHDGRTVKSLVTNRLKRQILGSISSVYYARAKVVNVRPYEEIWFLIPSSASAAGEIDTIWAWNYVSDAWTKRKPPPGLRYAAPGVRPINWGSTTWDTDDDAWENDVTTWAESPFAPALEVVGGVTDGLSTGDAYIVELGGSYTAYFSEELAESWVERIGLEIVEGRGFVDQVVLSATGGDVEVEVGAAESPEGPYSWSRTETWKATATRRLPFRGPSGHFHAIRLKFPDPTYTRVSRVDISVKGGGTR
jgi:hypothetical protein